MTINRDTARRYTTRARVASIALLVAAGAVFAVPLDLLLPSASPASVLETDPDASEMASAPDDAEPPMDLTRAISAVWRFGPPQSVEPPTDPESPAIANNSPDAPTTTPAVPPGTWRYIGSIVGPRGMHAILEREGRQKLVKAGDEIEGVRVVRVETAQVTIDEGDGDQQIKLSPRASRWDSTQTASTVRAVPPPPRVNPNRAGVPINRPPAIPPQRTNIYSEMTDEEREKYEAEKIEKYREAGEDSGLDRPMDGGSR
jgi:hypothetical protein